MITFYIYVNCFVKNLIINNKYYMDSETVKHGYLSNKITQTKLNDVTFCHKSQSNQLKKVEQITAFNIKNL